MAKMTMVQALNLALRQEMENDDNIIVLGEDVGVDGGVFRVTDGLIDKFGDERVLDTPLAESARLRWRSQGRYHVPMVLRTPYGGGVRALEHHSESREAYWAHTPGLKMVIPSGPRNARALLVSAIRDPDPVIFYESKALYRAFREEVPEAEETMPIGTPQRVREGKDVTMISYGAMMRPTLEAALELKQKDGVEAEVIDVLTISPLNETIFTESVKKTGRAMVIHEAPRSFGPGAEIVTRLMEKAFYYLEAPIERVAGFDIIIPLFSREKAYLPGVERILRAARKTLEV
jgi:pyruvate dehydrogenase E1 component beta subunit